MWGLVCGALLSVRGGVRFVERPRTAGRALPHSTLMFLRADRACCGGYTASASRFGGAALLAGLSACDVEGSTRVLDRVLGWWSFASRLFLVVLVVGLLWVTCGGRALRLKSACTRRRPVASTGARRRRARVERSRPPLSCGGSRRRVSS